MCDQINNNIPKPCANTQGGVRKLYLWNYVENPFTITGRQATAINSALTVVYEFLLIGDDNTLSTPLIGDFKTGTKTGTETLTVMLKGINQASQDLLDSAAGAYLSGCVVDRNGNHLVVGFDEGFNNITVEPNTGGARADANGYNCVFVSEAKNLPAILDSATVTALEALVYVPA